MLQRLQSVGFPVCLIGGTVEAPPLMVWGGEGEDEPLHGEVSVMGMSRRMEDEISAMTKLCHPDINGGRPVHYFAVYDGHGGTHVSTLCKDNMPTLVQEELEHVGHNQENENEWRRAMVRSFQRMEDIALSPCICGGTDQHPCSCDPDETAYCGSTANAAVLTQYFILVANTGDSRAVLCRRGGAIPLSFDHKPDRPDERARIEAAGGQVLSLYGPRVQGILATSRAIGDQYLKPLVSWEPEITMMRREPEDDCLIIASDGLWDVLSSQEACNISRQCLSERPPVRRPRRTQLNLNEIPQDDDDGDGRDARDSHYRYRCLFAAALLTRVAVTMNSHDNISVIVVDLKSGV
ncbi:PREDICTED: probable protein phosphatase 2C 75 [Tarenaya hassleriana]|uniref:probable protein phosphatase 2C 75 n=1 Tax=Tarenaya hassleriana TaxID=28532 RepID=UPI00053C70C3|nr:PREDICTED: probable protein phosphatase 2C 75 [Tarenaya hassleriana]